MAQERQAKSNEASEASGGKEGAKRGGSKDAIQASLELPAKFKEEDRCFMGTDAVEREERESGVMAKMVDMAIYGNLKFNLDHLRGMIKQNMVSEDALDQHLRHYLKKSPEICGQHCKCVARMLISQAREPGVGMGTQVVLLFKAVDLLRMAVMYSPQGADNVTSFLVLQIMSKMPPAFVPHMNREKAIFNANLNLIRALKEKIPTVSQRNKLAQLYMQQKNFADALSHYELMLSYFASKKPQTPDVREKICVINLNIADLYKQIFAYDGEFKNGQILQNFIYRYNREADLLYKDRHTISAIAGPVNKMTAKKVYKELQQLAVNHYEIALRFFPPEKNRKKRSEILVTIGLSYAEMGKFMDACERLQDSLLLLGKERNSEETFKEKEEILQHLKQAIIKLPPNNAKTERLRSFVVQEQNKLEAEKDEMEEVKRKREEYLKAQEQSRRKVL